MPELPKRYVLYSGASLFRCHRADMDPVYFGRNKSHRFDDPDSRFGVCYLATSPEGAFAETLMRKPIGQRLEKSDLKNYCVSVLHNRKSLKLIQCFGAGLHHLGLDSSISSTPNNAMTQAFSRDMHAHPQRPDGLIYRARHDDDQLAIALYRRAAAKLSKVEQTATWLDSGAMIERILDRYAIELMI